MQIPTDLLLKVHDTFNKAGATGDTCRFMLYPNYSTASCPQCPAAIRMDINDPTDTDCGLTKSNPDFQSSLDQFYRIYPEYAI